MKKTLTKQDLKKLSNHFKEIHELSFSFLKESIRDLQIDREVKETDKFLDIMKKIITYGFKIVIGGAFFVGCITVFSRLREYIKEISKILRDIIVSLRVFLFEYDMSEKISSMIKFVINIIETIVNMLLDLIKGISSFLIEYDNKTIVSKLEESNEEKKVFIRKVHRLFSVSFKLLLNLAFVVSVLILIYLSIIKEQKKAEELKIELKDESIFQQIFYVIKDLYEELKRDLQSVVDVYSVDKTKAFIKFIFFIYRVGASPAKVFFRVLAINFMEDFALYKVAAVWLGILISFIYMSMV